jgi:Ubiquitin-like autophagy protein Apg12
MHWKPTEERTPQKVRATSRYSYLSASCLTCIVLVVVRFKAVGNAPIMKQNFYKITAANRFQAVIQFLRKELGWKATDPLVSCAKSA